MLDLNQKLPNFPTIKTERLLLRKILPKDAEALFVVYSDPDVVAGHGRPPFQTVDQAQQFIEEFDQSFQEKKRIRWAITRQGEDKLLGTCGFHRIVPYHFRAEIGYDLASYEWRQGITSEAVRAIVQFGLAEIGFHRIEAIVDPDNAASAALLRKVGFTEEGFLRQRFYDNGRFVDDWFFSILKTEIDKVR